MRTAVLVSLLAALVGAAVAQAPGDTVTYTSDNGFTYTASIDINGDTRSPGRVTGAATATTDPLLATAASTTLYNANGNPVVLTSAGATYYDENGDPILTNPGGLATTTSSSLTTSTTPRLVLPTTTSSSTTAAAQPGGAAAGGGGGVATTYTGLQSISGYTPPPSIQLPSPTVPAGSIVGTTALAGYGNSSSSGALASLTGAPSHAAAAVWLAMFAGAAYALF